MRRQIAAALMSASLVGLASAASAADLPAKARPLPPPPVYSWSGFYIGVHVGSLWSTVESELTGFSIGPPVDFGLGGLAIPISSHQINGFLGGVQAGYNWSFGGPWVLGVETQWSWTDAEGTTPCVLILACKTDTKWVGTLAGRLGFTADRALIYVKAGGAWAKSEHSVSLNLLGFGFDSKVENTKSGWMWGAGVEYAFLPNWSAKLEYDFMDFGKEALVFPVNILTVGVNLNANVDQKVHLVKFGVNYRLGELFGKYPVAARY